MADKAIMKVKFHVRFVFLSRVILNLYLQQIAEQKLKAFSIGTMGKRPLSKKELEEQRKKEQEQAAAQVSGAACNVTLLVNFSFDLFSLAI